MKVLNIQYDKLNSLLAIVLVNILREQKVVQLDAYWSHNQVVIAGPLSIIYCTIRSTQ